MVNSEKIDEWIREVEERPASAPILLRFIANRLSDLASRNEELLAENIELRSGRKVEEYESRIANLEYQLELLKRQLSGQELGAISAEAAAARTETAHLLIYNPQGQILKLRLQAEDLVSRATRAALQGEIAPGNLPPRLLVTQPKEELLFVFDSGRTVMMPAADLPAADRAQLEWQRAYYQEPRGNEELAAVLPVATMALFDYCVQISRRGCVKKIRESFLESYLAKGFIGTGVKTANDKTCGLALCRSGDRLVLASREGFLLSLDVDQLPLTIEEALRLGAVDHVVAAFTTVKQGAQEGAQKGALLVVTHNGKAVHRELSWLEPASSLRTRGQPIFSKERREAGVRVAGAACVGEQDWGAALTWDGRVSLFKISDLFASGSLFSGRDSAEVVDFTTFSVQAGPAAGRGGEK